MVSAGRAYSGLRPVLNRLVYKDELEEINDERSEGENEKTLAKLYKKLGV